MFGKKFLRHVKRTDCLHLFLRSQRDRNGCGLSLSENVKPESLVICYHIVTLKLNFIELPITTTRREVTNKRQTYNRNKFVDKFEKAGKSFDS